MQERPTFENASRTILPKLSTETKIAIAKPNMPMEVVSWMPGDPAEPYGDYEVPKVAPQFAGDVSEARLSLLSSISTLSKANLDSNKIAFALIRMSDGACVSYNAFRRIYGGSTFNAPYCAMVLREFAEPQKVSIDDAITMSFRDDDMDEIGGFLAGTCTIGELIERSVIENNDNTFQSLRRSFDDFGDAFKSWKSSLINAQADYEWQLTHPFTSAATLAHEWVYILDYLSVNDRYDTPERKLLRSVLSSPNFSFMKKALERNELGYASMSRDIDVAYNKSGWFQATLCDAGMLRANHPVTGLPSEYVFAVLAGVSDTERNRQLFGSFCEAVIAYSLLII